MTCGGEIKPLPIATERTHKNTPASLLMDAFIFIASINLRGYREVTINWLCWICIPFGFPLILWPPKTTHYQPMINASNSGTPGVEGVLVPQKPEFLPPILMLKTDPLKWDMSCQVACWSQPTCPAHAPRSCGFPLAIAGTILFTCSCHVAYMYHKVIYSPWNI